MNAGTQQELDKRTPPSTPAAELTTGTTRAIRAVAIRDGGVAATLVLAGTGVLLAMAWTGSAFEQTFVTQTFVFALYGLSLGLVWGYGGMWVFGQALFFGLGAYSYANADAHVFGGTFIHLAIGVLGPVALATIIALTLVRRLSGIYFALATMILVFLAQDVVVSLTGLTGGANGFTGIAPLSVEVGPIVFTTIETSSALLLTAVVLLATYFVLLSLVRSRFGSVLVMIREDELLARSMGYRTALYRGVTFVLAAGVAGLAGVLYSITEGSVFPEQAGFALSAQAVLWLVVGGQGSLAGPVVGAFVFLYLQNELSSKLEERWLLIQGVLLIAAALWLRVGLLGLAERASRTLLRR